MFGWRWEQGGPWDSQGIEGIVRWLNRVWSLVQDPPRESRDAVVPIRLLHASCSAHCTMRSRASPRTLRPFSFNTAIARLMELTNALSKAKPNCWGSDLWTEAVRGLLLLLAPVTPHMTEELWSLLGYPYSIHQQDWPVWDEALLLEDTIELPVQINGKVRARITLPARK